MISISLSSCNVAIFRLACAISHIPVADTYFGAISRSCWRRRERHPSPGADGFGGGGLFAGGGGGGYSGGGGARPPVWVAVAARLTPVCPHSGGRFPGWRRRAHNHRACARGA